MQSAAENKAHHAENARVGILSGDDGISVVEEQFYALVDAMLRAVGGENVARQRWRPM